MFSIRGCRGLRVYGNRVAGGGDLGIVIEYSEEFTVSGNDVRDNEISGIVIHTSKKGTVSGNVCMNNCADRGGLATQDAIRAGIRVMFASRDVTISGNTCSDSRDSSYEKTQLYGVAVISTGTGNIEVSGNMLSGNKWGDVYTETAGMVNVTTPLSSLSVSNIVMQHYPVGRTVVFRTITSGLPSIAMCSNSTVTYLSSAVDIGATTIELSPNVSTQPAVGIHYVGVLLDNKVIHWSKITRIDGNIATLELAVPSVAATGNVVKYCRFLATSNFP